MSMILSDDPSYARMGPPDPTTYAIRLDIVDGEPFLTLGADLRIFVNRDAVAIRRRTDQTECSFEPGSGIAFDRIDSFGARARAFRPMRGAILAAVARQGYRTELYRPRMKNRAFARRLRVTRAVYLRDHPEAQP